MLYMLAKIYNTDNRAWPSLERMQELNSFMDTFSPKPQPKSDDRSSSYNRFSEKLLAYNPNTEYCFSNEPARKKWFGIF